MHGFRIICKLIGVQRPLLVFLDNVGHLQLQNDTFELLLLACKMLMDAARSRSPSWLA